MTGRFPELLGEQREVWHQTAAAHKDSILSQYEVEEIHRLGSEVMADTLRVKPNLPDVLTAPESFRINVERLLYAGITPDQAFEIVGQAVVISRHLASIRAFERV